MIWWVIVSLPFWVSGALILRMMLRTAYELTSAGHRLSNDEVIEFATISAVGCGFIAIAVGLCT